jgi:hypothetical protein
MLKRTSKALNFVPYWQRGWTAVPCWQFVRWIPGVLNAQLSVPPLTPNKQKGTILMKRYLSRINIAMMALAVMGLATLTALAVARPFHLVEHGKVTITARDDTGAVRDLVADGVGTATHLGLFTLHREAVLTARSGGPIFDVQGEATLTAATGEQLRTSFTGTIDLSVGHADLIYEWTGGSKGRFENATGTTVWSVDAANGSYDAVAEGELNY